MTHRGPDGEGLKEFVIAKNAEHSDEHVTVLMGHRRLAIIDLSQAAAQPMSTSDGRFHLVFNGEIFNYRELRQELEVEGITFQTRCDSEVVLNAYLSWGNARFQRMRVRVGWLCLDQRVSRGKRLVAAPLTPQDPGRSHPRDSAELRVGGKDAEEIVRVFRTDVARR